MNLLVTLLGVIGLVSSQTISDIVNNDTELTIFKELIDYYSWITDLNSTFFDYTVFAPTDAAFMAASITNGTQVDFNLFGYFLVSGNLMSSDLVNGTKYSTNAIDANFSRYEITYINGMLMDAANLYATFNETNLNATNGVVHKINEVIYPGNLIDYLLDNPFVFSTLVSAASLVPSVVELLSSPGEYTLLAPNNTGFARIDPQISALLLQDTPELGQIFAYHVVNKVVMSTDIMPFMNNTVQTLQGSNITINGVNIFGIEIYYAFDAILRTNPICLVGFIIRDIRRGNGVLHSIDCVLTPKSLFDVMETNVPLLASTIESLGLSTLFTTNLYEFTVLGPQDSALSLALSNPNTTTDELTAVLAYHAIPAIASSSTVASLAGTNVLTFANVTLKPGIGTDLNLTVTDSISQLTNVTITDKYALNGILHIINGVLIPGTIAEIAATNPQTVTIAQLAFDTGVADLIANTTILLPYNDVLTPSLLTTLGALPGRYGLEILQYHMLLNTILTTDMTSGPLLTTALKSITVDASGPNPTFTDLTGSTATLIDADIVGFDGTVNIINKLLLPFDLSTVIGITLAEFIATNPSLSKLNNVVAISGYASAASSPNTVGLTILAPYDSAFSTLPDGATYTATTNSTIAAEIIGAHVINGTILAADVLQLNGQYVETLTGVLLQISVVGQNVYFIDPAGRSASVLIPDQYTNNGIIHIIDTVLSPKDGFFDMSFETIVDYLSNNTNSTTLTNLTITAGLVDKLSSTGPFTLFAPLNKAFSDPDISQTKLNSIKSNKTQLAMLLKYHVVSGIYMSTNLMNGDKLMSLQGSNITIINNTNGIFLQDIETLNGDAKVMSSVPVSNGIIHFINKLISYQSQLIQDSPIPATPAPTANSNIIKPSLITFILFVFFIFQ